MPGIINLDNLPVDVAAASMSYQGNRGWSPGEMQACTAKVVAAMFECQQDQVTTSEVMAKLLPKLTEKEAAMIFLKGMGVIVTNTLEMVGVPEV